MKLIKAIFLPAILLFAFSCKKDKLTGDYRVLTGTWTSISNSCGCCTIPGTGYDPFYKLELVEKGKYTLYQGGKKIECGRLLNADGFVTFECGESKSHFDGKKIHKFNNDTLNIDRRCENEFVYTFVKK
jgi:hypothetical protein